MQQGRPIPNNSLSCCKKSQQQSSPMSISSDGSSLALHSESHDSSHGCFFSRYRGETKYTGVRGRNFAAREDTGLPKVCTNCGRSFFSFRLKPATQESIDGDDEGWFCSGECKWSMIMHRQMDEQLSYAIHQDDPDYLDMSDASAYNQISYQSITCP